MKYIWIFLIVWFIVQTLSTTRAETVQHPDGLYYLVLSGSPVEITRYCSYGDCQAGFASRRDALNAWVGMMGAANGYTIAPLPPPSG